MYSSGKQFQFVANSDEENRTNMWLEELTPNYPPAVESIWHLMYIPFEEAREEAKKELHNGDDFSDSHVMRIKFKSMKK